MMTKIWINHSTEEVVTEAEFNEMLEEKVTEYLEDGTFLSEWLDNNFTAFDIWSMTTKEQQAAEKQFKIYARDSAIEELQDDGWKEYTLNL